MKPAQLKYQRTSLKHVKRPMDNFVYWTHHFYHSSTHQPVYQLCNKDSIQKWCSLQIMKASSVSIPTSISPNVWIITCLPAAVPARITLIYPGGAPRTITLQTPIHILWLQPTCNTTSQHFHLPPCYESHGVTINISLNSANLNVINISALEFRIWQHLEDLWNGTLLHHLVNIPSVPLTNCTSRWFPVMDLWTHFCLLMS